MNRNANDLDNLIQEIIDFGDVITYTENPADPHFLQACKLFHQYLQWRFKELKEQYRPMPGNQLSEHQVARLDQLICNRDVNNCDWIKNLFEYSMDLQRSMAA